MNGLWFGMNIHLAQVNGHKRPWTPLSQLETSPLRDGPVGVSSGGTLGEREHP